MEGEVDWKAAYDKLKHHHDKIVMPLLLKALSFVPEDSDHETEKRAQSEDHPFRDRIAPWDSGYPLILRAADPEERERLIESVKKKIDANGNWIGAQSGSAGHKRPQVGMATKRAKEQQKAGDRPEHIRKSRKTSIYQPTVPFPATHVVLLQHGHFPREGDVGSHLCHTPSCVNIDHLVWESSADNNRRENLCNKRGVCRCGLQPSCNFTQHKK